MSRKTSKERKKDIVKATLNLVGKKGVGSLRTSQIAEQVGFSEAALYKHFDGKKEVIRATIQTAGGELIESLKNAIEKAETDENLLKLRKVLETHLGFIADNPGITRLLFSDEVHFNEEDLQNELFKIVTEYKNIVKNLLEEGIRKEQVREDIDLDAAFTLYFGIIQTQILFWSLSGGKKSIDEQADELWEQYKSLLKASDSE